MLGGEIVFASANTIGVRTDWVWLTALKVLDYQPPTWPQPGVPKQIHLDVAVTDLQASVVEAERLGATPAAVQPAPDRWRVLLDPAGHPFCLTTQIPPRPGSTRRRPGSGPLPEPIRRRSQPLPPRRRPSRCQPRGPIACTQLHRIPMTFGS